MHSLLSLSLFDYYILPSLTSYSNVYKPRPKSYAATMPSSLMAQLPSTICRPGWSNTASTVIMVDTIAVRTVVGLITCAVAETGRFEMTCIIEVEDNVTL